MLEIKKITRGFQITLPKSFREKYHLGIGDLIEFIENEKHLIVKPVKTSSKENAAKQLLSFLNKTGDCAKGMTEEQILKLAHQERIKVRKLHESRH